MPRTCLPKVAWMYREQYEQVITSVLCSVLRLPHYVLAGTLRLPNTSSPPTVAFPSVLLHWAKSRD
mgnify:CR=1 FL=1